jgi:hypothetical protein
MKNSNSREARSGRSTIRLSSKVGERMFLLPCEQIGQRDFAQFFEMKSA